MSPPACSPRRTKTLSSAQCYVPSALSRDCTQQALNKPQSLGADETSVCTLAIWECGITRPRVQTGGQLRKRLRHVCDVNIATPILGLMPPIPDSWLCSCSLPGLRPCCKKQWVLGNRIPTTPPGASGPEPRPPGWRGGTHVRSQCNCQTHTAEFLNSKIKRLQVGSLPGGPTQAKSVCQQILSALQLCSEEPADSSGAAVLASRARKSVFPAHTHSPAPSINTGPWMLRQPPHRP